MSKVNRFIRFTGFLLCFFFSYQVSANGLFAIDKVEPQRLDSVDKDKAKVVVDDIEYKLKLNTKIFGPGQRLLNRYALKEGQQVHIKSVLLGKELYVETIFINKI